MYGQGNFAPHFGQRPRTSIPPFPQHFPASPSLSFQQGLPATHPPITQQGPALVVSHAGQLGPSVYQHTLPTSVQQGLSVPVPPSGVLSSGQSYLNASPQVHIPVPNNYTYVHHNSHWTQNAHHIPPPPAPPPHGPTSSGPSCPEMLQSSSAPTVLPPPSQGQVLFRGPVHPSNGDGQGLQNTRPPPPPPPLPASNFYTPAPLGSFVHSKPQDSHMPSVNPPLPPPPPSSPPGPPPLPPSSPPPITSPHSKTSLSTIIEKCTGLDVMESLADLPDDASKNDDLISPDGHMGAILGSQVEDGIQSGENMKPDFSPPPCKPVEDRVMQKIDILCQLIAKNGPEFESMTRKKEFGNPEFDFLFGGEPGSEAAAAHEYFEWMKRKCVLEFELHGGCQQSNSPCGQLGFGSSMQPGSLRDAVLPHSPADSDMDMEDDITLPDEEQHTSKTVEISKHEAISVPSEVAQEQPHAVQSAALAKDSVSGNSGVSVSVEPAEVGTAKCASDSNLKKSSVPQSDDFKQRNASAADVDITPQKNPTHVKTGASPFSLLQDYDSDDGSENDDEPRINVTNQIEVSRSIKSDTTSLVREVYNFEPDLGSKTFSECKKGFLHVSEPVMASSFSMPSRSLEFLVESENIARGDGLRTVVTENAEEHVDNSDGIKESIDNSIPCKAFQQKGSSTGPCVDTTSGSAKELVMEDAKIKVDEFGRLVREGYSNSDSDGSHYSRRHSKRGRSRSRSRSPYDRRRRRRRRSPWRRRENYSRSRSLSPKKRRSRSRSPSFRHGRELGGDRMRRDKGQLPQCFDFLRGRCYRGALCRYWHHDSDRSDRSRNYKGKQNELPSSPKIHDLFEDIETGASKKSVHGHEFKTQGVQLSHGISTNSLGLSKDGITTDENAVVSIRRREQHLVSCQHDESLFTAVGESERSAEVVAEGQEKQNIEGKLLSAHISSNKMGLEMSETSQLVDGSSAGVVAEADSEKVLGDTSQWVPSCTGSSMNQQSQSHYSELVFPSLDHKPKQRDNSFVSDHFTVQTSSTISSTIPISEPHQSHIPLMQQFISENLSCQSPAATELSPPISHPPFHLPLLPPTLLQVTYAQSASQLPGGQNFMSPTSKYPFYSASMENCAPYKAPMPCQYSQFALPFHSSWNSGLPPPPPPPLPQHSSYVNDSTFNTANALHGVPSLQLQQHLVPPRNEFPSACEPDRPLSDMKDFRTRTVPMGSQMNQPPGGLDLVGEGQLTQPPVQGLISSNLFAQGNVHSRHLSLSRASPKRNMHTLPNENLPPSEVLSQSSQSHPFFRRPSHGLQHAATDSVSIPLGDPAKVNFTMSRYTSDFLDRNQPSRLSDIGGSRIMSHYNPYASTFDRPLPSKFSSSYFNQEKEALYSNKYVSQFALSPVPVDTHGVGSLGTRNMTSSPNSVRVVERNFPRSGGDQYDPLFDSIEPSPNSFRKSDFGQKRETTDDSDIMLRFSGSNKPLDVEENNKQKAAAAIAVTMSTENEEYGETADAEIGAVENESLSNPIDEANTAMGEIEIDQVKTSGKGKKRKDSRSMKQFRIALASFVKEVLKPSWRQGNMSKEAFKTIVKKTVDKVSGTMKSHHIPKSQAKINQYIDSSQRKLTKLVMGYVDKYVKV